MILKSLVFGTGFLGTKIIDCLQQSGHEVTSFSRSYKSNVKSNQHVGDIKDIQFLRRLLDEKPDLVINTIWITKPGEYLQSKLNSDFANFSIAIAEIVKEYSISHYISLGSCAEYQLSKGSITSTAPSISDYVIQKIRAYEHSESILNGSNTVFSWPRIFFAYGPGQDDARLFQSLITKARRSDPITILDTTTRNDWISSFDIAEAISWIATNKLSGPIDIGTGIGHTNLQVWDIIKEELNSNSQLLETTEKLDKPANGMVASVNSELFNSGWRPKLSIQEGIRLMIQA
jgi:dTDP-6-deoxy-L-talose 4-dehydrogenase (NAD+)